MLIAVVRYRVWTGTRGKADVNAGHATAQARSHPARLRIGVVGTGRVGSALGAALARAGHTVVAASAVTEASVRRARRNLPGVPLSDPLEVAARAELVLLTVPDDDLPGLVAGLAATGAALEGRLLASRPTSAHPTAPAPRPAPPRRHACAPTAAAPDWPPDIPGRRPTHTAAAARPAPEPT